MAERRARQTARRSPLLRALYGAAPPDALERLSAPRRAALTVVTGLAWALVTVVGLVALLGALAVFFLLLLIYWPWH